MANFFQKSGDSAINEKSDDYSDLSNNIAIAKKSLQRDYENLQYVKNEKLIDYYIYKIKSDESRYDFLLKQAKSVEKNK